MITRYLHLPLTEGDALELCAALMPGSIHLVPVRNVFCGRKIMYSLADVFSRRSLCITTSHIPLRPSISTVTPGCGSTPDALERLLLDIAWWDLLWIEATPTLLTASWYHSIEKTMDLYRLYERCFVYMLVYEDRCDDN